MNLNYYIDFKHLCDVKKERIAAYFSFVYNVYMTSANLNDGKIKESFYRDCDDEMLKYNHKSGDSIYQVIFSFSGEIGNKIIPFLWESVGICKDLSKTPFGYIAKGESKLHPNGKLVTKRKPSEIWHITETKDYHAFRLHHILETLLSNDCDDFLLIYLPHCKLTKKALVSYKSLSRDDKIKIIADLKLLDDFIANDWGCGDFPIDLFSKTSGVDASDESEPTKKHPKYKEKRKFSLPKLGSVYCFHHIKLPNKRIHFFADPNTKTAHIAYIGKHLPTVKH